MLGAGDRRFSLIPSRGAERKESRRWRDLAKKPD